MPPKKAKGKKKKEEEPDDEYKSMTGADLTQTLEKLKERVNEMRTNRNYIQMDRDMVENFYHNTLKEISEVKTKISNKETEAEEKESKHRIDVKVFLQKVKHLEYEQEKSNLNIEDDGKKAKEKEDAYFEDITKNMKQLKTQLKSEYLEKEKANIQQVQEEKKDHQSLLKIQQKKFDELINNLIIKYEERLAKLKEDLELKLKVEIHELEERKNLHINELMNNHEKAFAELKKYYNDITAENLNLIKAHKEKIAQIYANIQLNTKNVADNQAKNEQLKEPLAKHREIRNKLKEDLKQFAKHKMSLQNLKSKAITLKDKITKLERDGKDLDEKYEKVVREKQELEKKFEDITQEVKKNADLNNNVLSNRLQILLKEYNNKEEELRTIIDNAGLDHNLHEQLKQRVQQSIEAKNTLIKNLKYSIHHATKAYNDAIRVYEAKLVEFGIPIEELGFQPLETITSSMPAGLVSS
ncbi:growth-arrest-specific microtubule-binding protein (macronuclear) [Tetrahymena thermophila SB210]|uniref:Growth-arrest-specific microtubule-binding protein n=1 Tax=Tetrahymena thermophila (strain SB210) TaxID=312017 RepID=Q23YW7_TETTS|nr:growth-arrest-specific microtubule-binding protein [Tetrahymena thermophila SB210]EAS01688.1 growth-arrest-specific microtubule-binding protein [Tetrahymena thermophila SB210]8TEK_E Chain E, Growth-arrest-specific microtubule-binding protein [Tetrahymena thermophila]8TH8_E Chain E, Growth-arrest-specific microtubule-binding protein [Tetrahymena thermophila]8TID_E Chain E, Growth-arrest-specific microtubule-binding protein [Tetrahymena thermophila]|eukprot:XP_001021933.1 growth-arrest-specific microtubule-binding protein [Tetrahymena thermophila SB210]